MRRIKNIYDYTPLLRIFKIILDCSKGWMATRFFLIIIQAILPLIPLYLMKLLLDAFVGEVAPEFKYIFWILISFAAVQIISILVSNAIGYISMVQSDLIQDHMSELIIDQSIKTDLEKFDSDKYHDTYQRAVDEAGTRPVLFINALNSFLQNMFGLLAILGLLIALHWSITLVLLVIAAPVVLIRWLYTNKFVKLRVRQTQLNRRSNYLKEVLTTANFAKEVRVFNYGKVLLKRFADFRNTLRKEKKQLYFNRTRSLGLAQAVEASAIVIALGLIAHRAIKGFISVGDIAMYFGAFQKGQSNINNALKAAVSIHENRLFLQHLFEFLDLKNEITDPPNPKTCPSSIDQLEFRNLSFTYPETNKQILNDISLTINKGEMVAIVGENGSGKTTLVKLIQRLYDLKQGSILLNGINIKEFNIDDLRSKMTIIFQQFSKYNFSASENIEFANIYKERNLSEVEKAAQLSHADDFVKKLAKKYDTQLGRLFRDGEELSGGQWQKIALARAFYKEAEIIILDEPTSFIDPVSEEEIFQNFKSLSKDKIFILITHRIYNLKQADKIIVMNDGKIIEQGSHDQLMAFGGQYKAMFESQE